MGYVRLNSTLTATLRRELEAAFRDAEHHAQSDAEPAVVRALGLDIARRCNGLQHGGTRVGAGVGFIHQASHVRFAMGPRQARCEAGDLLVIARRLTAAHSSIRAVLLQAKRFPTPTVPTSVPKGDPQHFLYHRWPLISYTFGRNPGTTKRVLTRDRRFQGSRYLMIPRSAGAGDRSSVCVTEDHDGLGRPEPAPTYVLNLLRDHAGVPYTPNARGDWHGFVDDLLHRVQRPSSAASGADRSFGLAAQGDTSDNGLVVVSLIARDDDAMQD